MLCCRDDRMRVACGAADLLRRSVGWRQALFLADRRQPAVCMSFCFAGEMARGLMSIGKREIRE